MEQPATTLCDVRQGTVARILEIDESVPDSRRLQEMGLTVGTVFKVLKVAPLGDPIELELRGFRLCLRKGEGRFIRVEFMESDSA